MEMAIVKKAPNYLTVLPPAIISVPAMSFTTQSSLTYLMIVIIIMTATVSLFTCKHIESAAFSIFLRFFRLREKRREQEKKMTCNSTEFQRWKQFGKREFVAISSTWYYRPIDDSIYTYSSLFFSP